MQIFDGSQKEVGRGACAIVFSYKGFAYKVYDAGRPKEWIDGELLMQSEINKTGLPTVKYYETQDPGTIKMDLIDGITLGDRMKKQKYKNGVEDLIVLQKKVHALTNVNVPSFKAYAIHDICEMPLSDEKKNTVLKFLEEIPDKNNLLHLDFHFLNIMYAGSQYYIIDWVNARTGNPIFDYARSYVIMNEFAYRLSRKYLSLITKDKLIDTADLKKAIYIMALLRTRENRGDKCLDLIKDMENELLSCQG